MRFLSIKNKNTLDVFRINFFETYRDEQLVLVLLRQTQTLKRFLNLIYQIDSCLAQEYQNELFASIMSVGQNSVGDEDEILGEGADDAGAGGVGNDSLSRKINTVHRSTSSHQKH